MSEMESGREGPSAAADEARSAIAAGAMLRETRESVGLHVAALAVSLKVPVKKLEALEAGRLDLLPDAVFARALAASVCRVLKVDPKPVLDLLPQGARSRLGAESPGAINTPFQAASAQPGAGWLSRPGPGVLAVLVLLLGALVIYFFPVSRHDPAAEVATDNVTAPASQPVPATAAPADIPTPTAGPAQASEAAPSILSTPTPPPATALATAAPVAAATDAADPARLVVFVARAESWVQVTDAKGTVLVQRTLQANDTAEATGALPLAVVVGRIDAVAVQVRGKTLDLAPVAKNNVARFEVK